MPRNYGGKIILATKKITFTYPVPQKMGSYSIDPKISLSGYLHDDFIQRAFFDCRNKYLVSLYLMSNTYQHGYRANGPPMKVL